ncbi:hypothetical protein CASFOL_005492 [Castilleja foliolosa]|uniref:Uncharacterized protein n=1 Tax=Castilleja foliolosa TaxID=1961234 RepID=A0ABD3E7L1_9LAMI
MAQNNTTKESESFCQKIHNAVGPFGARIFRLSYQPPGSPVRILHQPSHSKMIPVEFESHASGQVVTERDVVIVRSRKLSKPSPKKGKTFESELNDENKFSDYISKVKDRMLKTASNVNGVETSAIRDSFDDRVTDYIKRAKIKVRKNTSVGDDKSFSRK